MLLQRLATSARGLRAVNPLSAIRHSTKQPTRTKVTLPGGGLSTPSPSLLARQRLNRPVSPHLTIYRPQITWYLSALNRITGSLLSGAFYTYFFLYLVSGLFGWHLESKVLAEKWSRLGSWTKGLVKGIVAFPFAFHSFNGVRHLVWDMGLTFGKGTVIRTGWWVVGLSVVTSIGLAVY